MSEEITSMIEAVKFDLRNYGDQWPSAATRWVSTLLQRYQNAREKIDLQSGTIDKLLAELKQAVENIAALRAAAETDRAEIARLRELVEDIHHCLTCGGVECQCTNPPGDHEPPEDSNDWGAHAQYCPVYLGGFIAAALEKAG